MKFLTQKSSRKGILDNQLQHNQIKNSPHEKQIIMMASHLANPANIGMLIRACEGMGVEKLIICSQEFNELSTKMKRASRSAEQNLKIEFVKDLHFSIDFYKKSGFKIFGLEKTEKSINLNDLEEKSNKIVLICGNENMGLPQSVINQCDICLHIDLYGINSSINVAMASSIALWKIVSV